MNKLTARQQQVLELIRAWVADQGMPPTRAELARALGFSSLNAVEVHLKALTRKGCIERLPGTSRGIRLLEEADPGGIPLVGRVAAGTPILAQQHIEGHYRIEALFEPPADYLLRVQGMSMRDVGILDGDLLAVHRTTEVHDGQIVVARLGEEVTVKRFERQGPRVWLLPENPEFQPIPVDPQRDHLVIEGIAVGVIRNGRL